jgi:hypothetical protein
VLLFFKNYVPANSLDLKKFYAPVIEMTIKTRYGWLDKIAITVVHPLSLALLCFVKFKAAAFSLSPCSFLFLRPSGGSDTNLLETEIQ